MRFHWLFAAGLIFHMHGAYSNIEQHSYDNSPSSISSLEVNQFEMENLEFINMKGVEYFLSGQFEEALVHFDQILNALYDNQQTDKSLFGAALWERLFCHAYADLEEEVFKDLTLIRAYFIDESYSPSSVIPTSSEYRIFPVAEFSNPNERISPSQCKERVRGTASTMRLLAARIPNRNLAEAVCFTITELEYAAYGCCERAQWTECLSPIVDSWQYLKKCLDKGVAIAPNLASPGR